MTHYLLVSGGKRTEEADENPDTYGVHAWSPFAQKLSFDIAAINALPKTYIHCLHSQFLALTRTAILHVKPRLEQENWAYLEIDADHNCMVNAAEAVVEALVVRYERHSRSGPWQGAESGCVASSTDGSDGYQRNDRQSERRSKHVSDVVAGYALTCIDFTDISH